MFKSMWNFFTCNSCCGLCDDGVSDPSPNVVQLSEGAYHELDRVRAIDRRDEDEREGDDNLLDLYLKGKVDIWQKLETAFPDIADRRIKGCINISLSKFLGVKSDYRKFVTIDKAETAGSATKLPNISTSPWILVKAMIYAAVPKMQLKSTEVTPIQAQAFMAVLKLWVVEHKNTRLPYERDLVHDFGTAVSKYQKVYIGDENGKDEFNRIVSKIKPKRTLGNDDETTPLYQGMGYGSDDTDY